MADRRVKVILEAEIANFKRNMKAATDATEEARKSSETAEQSYQRQAAAMEKTGAAMMLAGTAMVAALGLAVKGAADFDAQMSSVQAATHETADNMRELREAAIEAGADTAFSAVEAAQGIEELAKAGVSTKDVLAGGLKGALDLAAAGELGVAEAAETTASALTQFQLGGDQATHVADLLAAGAGKAQGGVHDMGLALSYAGVAANGMGVSIEETTGTIAMFASAGIIGEKAGTALRSMFVSMANPTNKTRALMDDLGLSFEDGTGKFIGMAASAQQLQEKLAPLPEMERNAALAQIFGNEALGAAQTLYREGAKGVEKWTDAVNDSGYAAETAAIKQDNLKGDLEKLGGSFETVFIKSGSGANEMLRYLVQGLESFVDMVGSIPTPVLAIGTIFTGVVGGATLLSGAVLTAIPKIRDMRETLRDLGTIGGKLDAGLGRAGTALGKIGKVAVPVAATAGAVVALAAAFTKQDVNTAEEMANAVLKLSTAGEKGGLDSLFDGGTRMFGKDTLDDVKNLDDAVAKLANQSWDQGINNWADDAFAWTGLAKSEVGQVEDKFLDLGDAMGSMVKDGNAEAAAKTFQEIAKSFEAQGKSAEDALNYMPGYKAALVGAANAAGDSLEGQALLDAALGKTEASTSGAAGAQKELETALEGTGLAADGAVENLEDFLDMLFATGLATMNSRDASYQYQASIREVGDTVKEIAKSGGKLGAVLNKNKTDFNKTSEAGEKANSAFQAIARDGIALVEAKAKEGMGQPELQASLNQTYKDLIAAAGEFNITGDAADNLARKVLGVPDGISIKTWMDDVATQKTRDLKAEQAGIDRNITITTTHVESWVTKGQSQYVAADGSSAVKGWGQGYGVKKPMQRAGGGSVFGPGTETSDSIPALLSTNEHVLSAREVRGLGGHAAVERLRAMARAGSTPGFRDGGSPGWAGQVVTGGTTISLGGIKIYGATDAGAVQRQVIGAIEKRFKGQGLAI